MPAACGVLFVAGLIFLLVRQAAAQERPGAVYVLAGVTVVRQDGVTGESSVTYLTAPGGTTVGWGVAGGVFLWRSMSIEGEWSSSGMMSAREPSRYFMTFNEDRRDRFLGASVRFHPGASRRVELEPVVGIGRVFHHRWSQTEWARFGSPLEVASREHGVFTSVGVSAGADLRLGGPRVAILPSFRIRRVTHNPDMEWFYPGGFPRWTVSGGVSARFIF